MLNAKAFANATATVMAIWVIGCALFAYMAPDLLFTIAQSWTHSMNLEALRTTLTSNTESLILGFVSAVGLTWVITYVTIVLYNKWAKKG